jgi:hypothetical protein
LQVKYFLIVKVRFGSISRDMPQEKVCFSCLDEILSFIKSTMSGASDGDIFELSHNKRNPGVVNLKKIDNPSEVEVVPAWFKDWVVTNKPSNQQDY